MQQDDSRPAPPAPRPWQIALLACLVQLPLAWAPGYFSHDELQWAVWAETVRQVPWWDAGMTFQYRPLTFNLWMALSRALFAHPHAWHALLAAWGAVYAGVLCALLRRSGIAHRTAAVAGLVFVLHPYAVYVDGWVATLADLLWTGCALALAHVVLRTPRIVLAAFAGAALTLAALLAKEAAVAIPLLCGVAACADAKRRRRWLAAALAGAGAVAMFLAWRLPALLHAPRPPRYVPALSNVPARWLEYQLFPPLVPLPEVQVTLLRVAPAVIALAVWLATLVALWRTRRSLAALWIAGGTAALAPVLPLGESATQYGYAFAMVSAACLATGLAAARSRSVRTLLAASLVLTALHGGAVMARMVAVARVQAVFSPALADALRSRPGVVHLRLAPGAKAWIFQRLTHDVPAYAGVQIGDRVQLVDTGPADLVVLPDGRLQPAGR